MELAPTPRDVVFRNAGLSVYRFRRPATGGGTGAAASSPACAPLLLVPSLINRWYVLDLRPRSSLVEALTAAGVDVYCVDWGVPEDEDRYLTWDDVVARLARSVRAVKRLAGADRLGLLGYCMGGTLAGIHAALHPDEVAALVNLAGPFDFEQAGVLRELVDPRWFDADAIAGAGNIRAAQMQSGFQALRPTLALSKWVTFLDRAHDPSQREAFAALEAWGSDNVPFPAAAYTTYIKELYQQNLLVRGAHHAGGRRVDLSAIRCPVLTIVADADTICPPPAATALNDRAGSATKGVLRVPGGHVGAVVGSRASRELYPALCDWLKAALGQAHAVC